MRLRKGTRLLSGLTAVLLTGALATAAMAEPTGANPVPSPLSAQPASMWQTNNVVWAMEYHAGVVFAGGSFTSVRPPGVALNGPGQVAQGRLAMFNASTGAFISTFRPTFNGEVDTLNVSPDGSRLYVGGTFTQVNGQARQRLAVFDLSNMSNPSLMPTSAFNARLNRKVYDIFSTGSTVYVAGAFTRANNTPRTMVASFTANGGSLNPWSVAISGVPSDVAAPWASSITAGNGRVYIGGQFLNVNGVAQTGLGVVNDTTGASDPGFAIPVRAPNGGWVTDVLYSAPTNTLFIVGRVPPARAGTRLEGIEALNGTDGTVRWGGDNHRCLGDAFGLMVFDNIVWMATHAHDCGQIGSFPESSPPFSWHAALLGQDINTGEQVTFIPQVSGKKSISGSLNNTRAMTNDGTNMFVGGGFASVDGFGNQQDLIKFVPKNGTGGSAPAKPKKPGVTTSGGTVTITWTGVFDRDDRNLTYQVLRRNSNTPIYSVTADSPWWKEPTLTFTDTGVSHGDSVFYKIRVRDASNTVTSNKSNTITVQ
jgi:hypothetical protein